MRILLLLFLAGCATEVGTIESLRERHTRISNEALELCRDYEAWTVLLAQEGDSLYWQRQHEIEALGADVEALCPD